MNTVTRGAAVILMAAGSFAVTARLFQFKNRILRFLPFSLCLAGAGSCLILFLNSDALADYAARFRIVFMGISFTAACLSSAAAICFSYAKKGFEKTAKKR